LKPLLPTIFLMLIIILNNTLNNSFIPFFPRTLVYLEIRSNVPCLHLLPDKMKIVNQSSTSVGKPLILISNIPPRLITLNTMRNRSNCAKILKKQKRLGWKKFCSQFISKTPTSEIWSLVKLFKKRKFNHELNLPPQIQLYNNVISKLCPPSCYILLEFDKLISQ